MGSLSRRGGAARLRHRGTRGFLAATLVIAGLGILVTPASAHPSFGSAATFGFAPNTSGGTGATGSTAPYAPGTIQTLYSRVPYEQGATTYTGTGGFNTTIRTDVIVPAGWANPACSGAPKKNLNNASTSNTNQPGDDVTGWSCAVVTEGGHQVLRWTGPQLANGVAATESAVWFVFTVTVPSPVVQTTYDGRAGSGTEGFIIDQYYASSVDPSTGCSPSPCAGSVRHWYPNADYPGVVPPGATLNPGDVATGLVRTVAGTTGSTTITSDAGSISGAAAVAWSPVSTAVPTGIEFPYGRVSFTVTGLTAGQTVHVTITYPGPVQSYWKYDGSGWSQFAGAQVNGNVVTLTLVDGGTGDADGAADGKVVDPGAAAVPVIVPPTPTPVPIVPTFTG